MADEATKSAGTVVAESEAAEQGELDALLTSDEPASDKGTAAEKTEEPAETEETAEVVEGEEATEEDATEEAAESEEEAEEESDELSLEESDRDYSDAAYKKAADHYSKTKKIQLNPDDPAHRAMLKEVMDRGRDFAVMKAKEAAEAAKTEEEEAEAGKTEESVAKAPTDEQIQSAITNLQTFAKTRVVPKVASHITSRFTTALSKMIDEETGKWKVTQETANEFSEVMTEMLYHGLNDALPFIIDKNFAALGADPIMTRVTSMAVREGAFEHLDSLKDKAGKQLYPDLEKMVDSGEIQAALKANPWIGKSTFDERDPIRREAKRIEAAYKIARGEKVVPQVTEAVETGKKQAEAAARARGAARVAPGKTKGPLGQPVPEGEAFVKQLTTSRGGRFGRLLNEGKDK